MAVEGIKSQPLSQFCSFPHAAAFSMVHTSEVFASACFLGELLHDNNRSNDPATSDVDKKDLIRIVLTFYKIQY
jgi:hypothetical protein